MGQQITDYRLASRQAMFKEKLAIAGRGFRALIDRNDDRLHARTAPVFSRGEMARLFKRLWERRGIFLVV